MQRDLKDVRSVHRVEDLTEVNSWLRLGWWVISLEVKSTIIHSEEPIEVERKTIFVVGHGYYDPPKP